MGVHRVVIKSPRGKRALVADVYAYTSWQHWQGSAMTVALAGLVCCSGCLGEHMTCWFVQ